VFAHHHSLLFPLLFQMASRKSSSSRTKPGSGLESISENAAVFAPSPVFERNESPGTIQSSSAPRFVVEGISHSLTGTKRKQREEDDTSSLQSNRSAKSHRSTFSELSESWEADPGAQVPDPGAQAQVAKCFSDAIVDGVPVPEIDSVERKLCARDPNDMPSIDLLFDDMCADPANSLVFIIGKKKRAVLGTRLKGEIARSNKYITENKKGVQEITLEEYDWSKWKEEKKAGLEVAQEAYNDAEAKHLSVKSARIQAEAQLQRHKRRMAINTLLHNAMALLEKLPDEDSWANSDRFPMQKIRDLLGLTSTQAVEDLTSPWQCYAVLRAMEAMNFHKHEFVKGLWNLAPADMTTQEFKDRFGPYARILVGNSAVEELHVRICVYLDLTIPTPPPVLRPDVTDPEMITIIRRGLEMAQRRGINVSDILRVEPTSVGGDNNSNNKNNNNNNAGP